MFMLNAVILKSDGAIAHVHRWSESESVAKSALNKAKAASFPKQKGTDAHFEAAMLKENIVSSGLPFAKSFVSSKVGIAIMRISDLDLHSNISPPPFGAVSLNCAW